MEKPMKEFAAPVRGGYYRIKENPAIEDIILNLTTDQPVTLLREPDNRYDENAIIVMVEADPAANIGYVGKEFAAEIAPLLDADLSYTATIDHFAGPMAPVVLIKIDDGEDAEPGEDDEPSFLDEEDAPVEDSGLTGDFVNDELSSSLT